MGQQSFKDLMARADLPQARNEQSHNINNYFTTFGRYLINNAVSNAQSDRNGGS